MFGTGCPANTSSRSLCDGLEDARFGEHLSGLNFAAMLGVHRWIDLAVTVTATNLELLEAAGCRTAHLLFTEGVVPRPPQAPGNIHGTYTPNPHCIV